jgi:hypothetical protein
MMLGFQVSVQVTVAAICNSNPQITQITQIMQIFGHCTTHFYNTQAVEMRNENKNLGVRS